MIVMPKNPVIKNSNVTDSLMNLFSSFMFLNHGIEENLLDVDKYYQTFCGNPSSKEIIANLADIPVHIRKGNALTKDDYATLFYNTGKIILLGLVQVLHARRNLCLNEVVFGSTIGLISEFDELAYSAINKLTAEYAKDGVDMTNLPILSVSQYFEDGIEKLNHAEVLSILNTGIFYSVLGSFFGNFKEDVLKSPIFFSFGVDSPTIDATKTVQYVCEESVNLLEEKIYNLFQFCNIHNRITTYIEKSIGKTFENRFSKVFREIGYLFNQEYETQLDIKDKTDLIPAITSDINSIYDRMMILLIESINPVSPIYVGDHVFDHRPMWRKVILNKSNPYNPPFEIILQEENNIDYSALKNYTTLLDCHAYERLIKQLVLLTKRLNSGDLENKEYISDWYKLRYLEKLASDVYYYWENSKGVFKIDGVDPMCVDVPVCDRVTVKEVLPITKVPYSIAIKRALTTVRALNARYCEVLEYDYCKKYNLPIDDSYSKIDYVTKNDFDYSNIPNAARDCFTFMRVPYIFTIGAIGLAEVERNISTTIVEYSKLMKLKIFDSKYGDSNILRSPYDVIKDESFNTIVIGENDSEAMFDEIVNILKSLTAADYQYLITR